MKILVASKNSKKLDELEKILSGILDDFKLVSLRDFPDIEEVEETGTTFLENALLKAKTYSAKTGLPTIADDSGLMVFALNFRPGVYSARYGGEGMSDADKCVKLLGEMKPFSKDDDRGARFVSAVAAAKPGGEVVFSIGTCDGIIITEQRGDNGFGFDPIFMPEGYDKTFAELDENIKNKISHRAKALDEIVKFLPDFMNKSE